jgi:hypothetical protein
MEEASEVIYIVMNMVFTTSLKIEVHLSVDTAENIYGEENVREKAALSKPDLSLSPANLQS